MRRGCLQIGGDSHLRVHGGGRMWWYWRDCRGAMREVLRREGGVSQSKVTMQTDRPKSQDEGRRGSAESRRTSSLKPHAVDLESSLHGSTRDSEGSLNDKADVNCVIGNQKLYCKLQIAHLYRHDILFLLCNCPRPAALSCTAHTGLDNVNACVAYQE